MTLNKKFLIPAVAVVCLLLGFASSKVAEQIQHSKNPLVNIFEETKTECPGLHWTTRIDTPQRIYPISVSGELTFAGERVPLEDPDVRERLSRELQVNTYWHSNTLQSMCLANRYFPVIEKLLQENGVPDDFKYLALAESGLQNETSPAGATGFWQLVKPTAQSFGLEVNDDIDERYNLEKSTQAACQYLLKAKEQLGSWTMAAASYNTGIPAMHDRVNDQHTGNYYDLFLNQETYRYVFRILALKIIFSNPQRAGFFISPDELYQPYHYQTVDVDSTIHSIADFAAQYKLNYKQIKILNPWLRNAFLPNKSGKVYTLKILQAQ